MKYFKVLHQNFFVYIESKQLETWEYVYEILSFSRCKACGDIGEIGDIAFLLFHYDTV